MISRDGITVFLEAFYCFLFPVDANASSQAYRLIYNQSDKCLANHEQGKLHSPVRKHLHVGGMFEKWRKFFL